MLQGIPKVIFFSAETTFRHKTYKTKDDIDIKIQGTVTWWKRCQKIRASALSNGHAPCHPPNIFLTFIIVIMITRSKPGWWWAWQGRWKHRQFWSHTKSRGLMSSAKFSSSVAISSSTFLILIINSNIIMTTRTMRRRREDYLQTMRSLSNQDVSNVFLSEIFTGYLSQPCGAKYFEE